MKEGDIWNGWTVDSLIGEGGFGKVYKIVRDEFGHRYESALKVIRIPESEADVLVARNEGLDDESIEAYFYSKVEGIVSEFTLLSELKGNSNIVSYEDHSIVRPEDTIGWDIFIRMELLKPLSEHIYESEFTAKDAVRLGIDICNALELCQANRIIHRDIKPDNIFVSRTGNYKLGDFGVAREIEATATMTQAGTAPYMAPEICRELAYNSSVDMYSLGIVLYRLFNNDRLPFMPPYPEPIRHSDIGKANRSKMQGDEMMPPCNASGELGRIILKAGAYRPEDRYSSVTEMRAALESVKETDKKLYPLPPADEFSAENRKRKRRARIKKTVIILTLVVMVLAGLAGFALYNTDYYLNYYTPEYEKPELSEEDIESKFNGSWVYDESHLKKLKFRDVTMMVPANWTRKILDMGVYEEEDAQGRFAEIRDADDNRLAWVQIQYMGEYTSIDELVSDSAKRGINKRLSGEPIEISGCSEARKINTFDNTDAETVNAIVVICNGNAYWIGGGACGDNYSPTYFRKMLDSCEFKSE